jgi:hypothetical protein
MDKSYITFDVRSTSVNKPLGLEVKLNDTVVYVNESFIVAESIQVEIPNDAAEHSLKIILKNKTSEHTVLDTSGAIVQDASLVVENIKFDDIVVGHDILQLATYTHDCNGTDTLKEHKFYSEMGCNGTVELQFTTPIYLWLLENT